MALFWLQFAVVLVCLGIGGRLGGGLGLGAAGGLGMGVLVFGFGLQPDSPPISAMLIIIAVITCVTTLQSAGGLDYLVTLAEKMLRRHPGAITIIGPLVCYLFTVFCGTSYVAFSAYPVIAEVATEAKIRPERAMSMSVIAANMGIVGSPMSAATAGMIGFLSGYGVTPFNLLLVCLPGSLLGCIIGCLFVFKRGKELDQDEAFQQRVASGEFQDFYTKSSGQDKYTSCEARKALLIFSLGMIAIVILGSFTSLLPFWKVKGTIVRLGIPSVIQIIMLSVACLIMLLCKTRKDTAASGSIFGSGLIGVVGILGVSWMTGTFFEAYKPLLTESFGQIVANIPMLYGLIIFIFSAVIYSPAATVASLIPLGLGLGLPPATLIALYPATCGAFIIPGGAQIGCIAFDRTGTTRIGKYVINHSYLLPGIVTMIASLAATVVLAKLVF